MKIAYKVNFWCTASILELCDNQKEMSFLELKALKDGIATFKEVKEISDKVANLQDQELRPAMTPPSTSHVAPVTQSERLDSKKAIVSATSID